MAKTESYGFELPNPSGIQLTEIDKIAQAIIAIDLELKAASTALTQHTHAFGDIADLPTTLAGYGIEDAMTANQVKEAISAAVSGLLGSDAPEALDTLSKLAAAVGGNPKFSDDVATALGLRVSVDAAQGFTQAQKTQGRSNIDALGAVDKGKANGVAPLDANKKVPEANLPALTTTATVGAATAAAASKQTPADSDFFSGVLAGGSTMFKTTWGNIKATLKSYFDGLYLGVGMLVGGRLKVAHIPHMQGGDTDGYVRITNTVAGDSSTLGGINLATNGEFWYSYNGVNLFKVSVTGVMGNVSIPASLVDSGVFSDARIPNLNASKTNAGVFHSDRIPGIDAAKLVSGTVAQARLPAMNYAPLPNTSTSSATTDFPIRTTVFVHSKTAYNRGQSAAIYKAQSSSGSSITNNTSSFSTTSSGASNQLSGTWLCRGCYSLTVQSNSSSPNEFFAEFERAS